MKNRRAFHSYKFSTQDCMTLQKGMR